MSTGNQYAEALDGLSGGGGGGTGFSETGTAVLVAGSVTISNANVASNSKIFVTCLASGGIRGLLTIANIIPGTSFDVVSSSDTDTSTIVWGLI